MPNRLVELFEDNKLIERIQKRLPHLFQLAEFESSRAGKIGMEIGSVRERIIVALLIYKFGEANVESEIPITESEVDVNLFGKPISIKTITGNSFGGVKLIWTVDAEKARQFSEAHQPMCDMLFVQINWGKEGGFFYIPIKVQKRLFDKIGRKSYIKLPKAGTNPRGIEITKEALIALVEDKETKVIKINWQRSEIKFNPYSRWIDLWKDENDTN